MEDSPKDNKDAFQDKPEESGENPASVNQQSSSSISAETSSQSTVPSFATPSQSPNINQPDQAPSSTGVFYPSRKRRIHTKYSRTVDALLLNREHSIVFQDNPEEYGRNPATFGSISPSAGQDASVSRPLPSAVSAETFPLPFIPTFAPSSKAPNIGELSSIREVFRFSRGLRIRTNCSRRVDALLSPRQNPSGKVDALLFPSQNPTETSISVPGNPEVGSIVTIRKDRSLLGDGRNPDFASQPQPSPTELTRSLSKAQYRQEPPVPSSEKRNVEAGIESTSVKRKRSECDSETTNLEMLMKSRVYETAGSSDVPEIQDAEVPMEEDRRDLLLEKQHSGGPSTSRERSEVGMDQDPPYLDVYEGQPSTLSHQPVITEDRFNASSGVTPNRAIRARETEGDISVKMVSKIAFIVQNLLLTVLKELMKVIEEMHVFKQFRLLFTEVHRSPCGKNEMALQLALSFYITQRETAWKASNVYNVPNRELLSHVEKTFHTLIRIVVTTLIHTVSVRSSLMLDEIMIIYKTLGSLIVECRDLWTLERIKSIQDVRTKLKVTYYIKISQKLLMQTRAAFLLFLMHVGDHADEKSIDRCIEAALNQDRKFLRRCIE